MVCEQTKRYNLKIHLPLLLLQGTGHLERGLCKILDDGDQEPASDHLRHGDQILRSDMEIRFKVSDQIKPELTLWMTREEPRGKIRWFLSC